MSNGRAVLYARDQTIVQRSLSPGAETQIADVHTLGVDRLSPPAYGPSFELSPDGRALAFSGWSGSGNDAYSVIKVVHQGGSAVELVRGITGTAANALFFQGWTPDGLEILFTKEEKEKRFSLWRMNVGGGEPRAVGLDMPGLRDLHINGDGTRLTFTAGWETGEVRVMRNFLPH
jgi:Tol biopolymer transport system component